MLNYLVETYVSGAHAQDARAAGQRARSAARDVTRSGDPVRHVRTTFVPGDETCFHVFEAASYAAVVEVCRLAEIESPRIVPVVE